MPFCGHRYTARLTLLVRFDDSVQSAPKREHLAWAAAAVSEIGCAIYATWFGNLFD